MKAQPTYPINLILEDKPCLVVGAGKVATRKLEALLASKANITIIADKATKVIQELADNDKVTLELRPFEPEDLDAYFLVFAATNDRSLNAKVVKHCQDKNIICCAVDNNWPDGHFVTPASFSTDDLTISVSSGGVARRKAKIIKQSIARHAGMLNELCLCVIGTDHHHLNLDDRESLHLLEERYEQVGRRLQHIWGVQSHLVINTCNRVETWAVVHPDPDIEELMTDIMGFSGLNQGQFFLKTGLDAFKHTAMVCAGMLSQTPGEYHIVNQIKEAHSIAADRGWSGSLITEWVDGVLKASKHMRRELEGKIPTIEIESLGLKFLETMSNIPAGPIAVIGTGAIGKAVAKQVEKSGRPLHWYYRNNRPDGTNGTQADTTEIIPFTDFASRLSEANAVICATGAKEPLLTADNAAWFGDSPTALIDLAVPRNIEPELNGANRHVIDMERLKQWHFDTTLDMEALTQTIGEVLDKHLSGYHDLIKSI